MASSRRFLGYDPYDHYYTPPYDYAYPYYTHSQYPAAAAPAPTRRHASRFFPTDEEYVYGEPVDVLRPMRGRARSVPVPVKFVGSEPEMEVEGKRDATRAEVRAPRSVPVTKKMEMAAEEAAVRVQAAARGFLARRMVREVRAVEAEAEEVSRKVEAEAGALRGDARGRIAVAEALMRLLLRLDAVHGAREYRRRVTKRVLAVQDAVDALEHRPATVEEEEEEAPKVADDAPAAVDVEAANDDQENMMAPAQEASLLANDAPAAVDMEEAHDAENEMAPESPHAGEHGAEAGLKTELAVVAPETGAEMEVDGGGAIGGEVVTENAAEQVVGGNTPEQELEEEAEGEWEMVTAESASAATIHTDNAVDAVENSATPEARGQERAFQEEKEKEKQVAGSEELDAKKVMEMVAALCEQSAQQCAVIGTLAERVDALERAVRRVEKNDRRRRRNKKLKKEGKAHGHRCTRSCDSD